ncbi:TRAP transporter substrate-binding protein [Paralimibaculum aggregatum]|uniref:TRAP transporter substrate-binding protein n=1 Tax=Paralimibaculum aggregatum TaxID=3036245 RepID=A0ABQ6LH96_9RHOB|nr:twin-arginine translocation signal domain-containing protein [Limibaculum sp. NKW23]GMG82668.1 TRAP transporter substrate-binding protein [Limibaculum sp. NKW23]
MTDTQARRNFLKGSLVAGAALATPHVARAQGRTLKMQGAWGPSAIFSAMAEQYVTRVNEMSGGSLTVEYLPAGAVVKAFQVQDAVSDGVLDGGHQVTAYWYGKHKAASLFGTGPVFGANASQILAWIHFGGGQELYDELINDVLGINTVGFWAMPMPAQPLGWFNRHVQSVDDMKGLKYRTVGLAADIMQSMGVNVTQLPGGEIVPALERGVIEAFEFNNPTSDKEFGAQDVASDYHMGSYHQAAEFFEIIWNRDVYEDLSPDEQAILKYAAEAASTANYGLAMDKYSADLQDLIASGTKVHRTDSTIMAAQLEAWDKVLEGLLQDEFFAKIVDSQKAWSERVAFYDLMNSADYKLAYDHYFPGKLPF